MSPLGGGEKSCLSRSWRLRSPLPSWQAKRWQRAKFSLPSCRSECSPVWRSSATFAFLHGVRCYWLRPSRRAGLVTCWDCPRSSISSTTQWCCSSRSQLRIVRHDLRARLRADGSPSSSLWSCFPQSLTPTFRSRTVLFLLIAGEPLLVIWSMARWGVDQRTVRAVGVVAVLLALLQIPIGVYQGLAYGWSDPVQGTLQGHGAGSHILGGLFALWLFVVIAAVLARRLNPVLGGTYAALCFAMMLATGSMSVLVIATLAAVIEPVTAPSRPHLGARRGGRLATVFLAVVVGASALVLVGALFRGFYERVVSLATSDEQPGFEIIWDHATSDPLALLLGSGPGTSASRASLLFVDPPAGSVRDSIGLEPTDLGAELRSATSSERYGGSVESAASSALGVAGDLGVVGFAALGMLFVAMWRRAGSSTSWLAPAGRAGLLLVAPLSVIDNWLEYPEFAIPFAILMGFVMSDAQEWTEMPVALTNQPRNVDRPRPDLNEDWSSTRDWR